MEIKEKEKLTAKIVLIVSTIQAATPGRRVFIQVFGKKEDTMLCSMILGSGKQNNGFDFKGKAIDWLQKNPDAFVSAESVNEEIPSGAVSGTNFIVSVSGGYPKDNPALAILLLGELEKEPVDLIIQHVATERAECKSELFALIDYLATQNLIH